MNRSSLAKRYLPLAGVVAVQLLIIALAPSKAPQEAELTAGGGAPPGVVAGPGGGSGTDADGDGFVDSGDPGAVAGDGTGGGDGGGGGGGGTTGGTRGTGGPAGSGGGGQQAAGDTSHCVDGRQFDAKIYFYAPPCVPKWAGGNNGGNTYQGVTDKSVKVVVYRGKPNPAVDAILDAAGANPTDEDVTQFLTKAFEFINAKVEFYGRKIEVKEVFGQCDTVPPDYVCLRGEMRDIVRREQPFAVLWPTILASPAFDELSALKVVNIGGQHFRDEFSQQRRPYHWDVTISGTNAAKQVAEWYCKRLHGKKAVWAGETGTDPRSQNPPNNDIRNKTRVLGVISTDDPENQATIKNIFKPELAKCGARVDHEFYYAQDISRAEEQRRLGVAKMRENPESTTIMCFCDAVAPVFLYRTAQEQSYFPEHVIVGTGGMDADVAGQSYDTGSTLCNECHQFENAFGLRSRGVAERNTNNAATRVYLAAGGKHGDIEWTKYSTAQSDIDYYMLTAYLISAAGPNLTPANVERGAFAWGMRGGFGDINDPHFNKRGFKPGSYAWFQDMDQVYYSQTVTSEFNGEPGGYRQIDGRRFDLGQYPAGDLPIPVAKPR